MALVITTPTYDRYTPQDRNILYVRAQIRSNSGATSTRDERTPITEWRLYTFYRQVNDPNNPPPNSDPWTSGGSQQLSGTRGSFTLPRDFTRSVTQAPRGTYWQFVLLLTDGAGYTHPFPTDDVRILGIAARSPVAAILADDSGAQRVVVSDVDHQSATTTTTPTRGFRGTLYWRLCEGSACSDAETQTSDITGDGAVSVTWDNLLGGRPYLVEVSQFADFRLAASASFTTTTIRVEGVRNSGLLMTEFAPLWRRALNLPSLRIFTGRMPAGYGERRHFESKLRTPANTMLRQLTARCFAGCFERRDNTVTILRRSFWPERQPTHHFDTDRYHIVERDHEDAKTEVRQELAVRSVRVLVYNDADAAGNTTTRGYTPPPLVDDNLIFGRRVYDISNGFFILIPNVPGTWEPVNYLVSEPAPRFLMFEVSDRLPAGTVHADLWGVDVMDSITVTLGHERHAGTLLERRFTYSQGRKRHMFTMIVHSTTDLTARRAWSRGFSRGFS